ncbi:MAG: hypothetical protein IKW51_11305 [Bacteroidales bacterium]|nr:hypothetical protein [Bacteroidales bacterium]
MEYNIELLGIIVGSIATILGGVWFMLYKAFNLGKVSHRMEEIEKKTSNADCKVHKENIEKIKEHNLPQRVEQIEKKISHADCEINNNIIKEIKEERLPQRIEQIEKKVAHADCEINNNIIKEIKEERLPQRIEQIEKKISHADCEINNNIIKEIKEERLPQRIEQIEKKVAHADCISIKDLIRQHEITFNSIKHCIKSINASLKRHEKYFEKIDKKFDDIDKRFTDVDKRFSDVDMNIKDLTRDVSSIKSFLSTKYNEDIDLVGLKNSPTKLTDFGNQILKEINGINFINENKEQLISRLDEERPRTALDVENSALIVFVNFCNSEKFDGIKNFIYNSPEYKVKDKNGRDITCNLSLMNVCFILSIPLRDMYLELHPEILKNV